MTNTYGWRDCKINKLALLWGEAQKKIAYSYLKMTYCYPPLSTGLLYPKLRAKTSGIIQKLYETKTNTNTG